MLAKEQINLFTKIHPSNDATVSVSFCPVPFRSIQLLFLCFYGNCGFVALMTATGSGVAEMHFE